LVSNQLVNAGGQNSTASTHWNVEDFGADCEVFVTCAQRPDASGDRAGLALRAVDLGASSWEGYTVEIRPTANNPDETEIQFVIREYTNGSPTEQGAKVSVTFNNGDKFGMDAIGSGSNNLRMFADTGSGFTERFARTNGDHTAAGKIGVTIMERDGVGEPAFTNFGGGTVGGDQSITGTPITASAVIQAPVVAGTGSATAITPSPIAAPSAIVSPVVAGSGSATPVTPSPIAASATVVGPVVSTPGGGDQTVTGTPITVASVVVAPTVAGSGSASVTPSPITAPSVVPTPTLAGSGSAPVTATPVVSVAGIQAPSASGTGSATAIAPSPLTAVAGIPTPSVGITTGAVAGPTQAVLASDGIVSAVLANNGIVGVTMANDGIEAA